MLFNLYELPN